MKIYTKAILIILFFSFLNILNAQFIQQGNKLVGSDAVGQSLQGWSVSISSDGNTAIVGGQGDNNCLGAAWVYTRQNGVWTQQGNKLVGSDAVGQAYQGRSVSISSDGNTAIVGGSGDNNCLGAAWVYTRQNGVWTQQGNKLVGSDAVGQALQGWSVSISSDGNTAIVGGESDNYPQGAAWVYTRQSGVWTQQGNKLVGSGAVGGAFQGRSVSISSDGNTAIVGGGGDNNFQGAAWVYTRQNGVWTQQGNKLVGSDAVGNSGQGNSVSISSDGNTAIVGGESDNYSQGAWVYTRQSGVWTQQGNKLVGSDAVGNSVQGNSVSISSDGNTAIVGGWRDHRWGDNNYDGAAWIYTRVNGVWTQQGNKIFGSDAVGQAYQGFSVSISSDGNTAIVGGSGDNNCLGAAWVFFNQKNYTIMASADDNGTISPNGNVSVMKGESKTFIITPRTGYHILDVVVDEVSKGALTSYTFTNITSNHTISSQFEIDVPKVLPVPVAVSPKAGVTIYTNTPTLYWSVEGSSEGLSFRIKYSTDPDNTNKNGDLKTIDAGSSMSYTLPPLEWNKTYYWQVQSIKGSATSEYSVIESFKVVEEQIVINPEIPITAWPIGGATVYLSSQYLTWYLLSGGANISSYTLKWGEGNNLSNIINGIISTTYPIIGLLPGHTYFWTVESVDRKGNHSLPSDIQSFITAGGTSGRPYTPTQAWPTGGAVVYLTSPTLSWCTLQPTLGIKEYLVRYSKNPDMSEAIEVHQNGSFNVLSLSNLEKGVTYYWQVQSYDGHVYSEPQTPPESFKIYSDNYYAWTPFALSPTGSIGISSSSIEFSWASALDKAQSYSLQYSTEKEFTQPIEIKEIKTSSVKVSELKNSTYYWRVQSKTQDGIVSQYSPTGKFTVMTVTGVSVDKLNAHEFSLLQNYPNPFNPTTSIVFNLPENSYVTLEVFNSIGKSIGKVFEGHKPKGLSSLQFNAEELPSGIYFYKILALDTNGKMNYAIKKMILLK